MSHMEDLKEALIEKGHLSEAFLMKKYKFNNLEVL